MINKQKEDTIIAAITPPGEGAVSVLRLSGTKSITATEKYFKGKVKLSDQKSHTIHYGSFLDLKGNILDDVLVSIFRTPNSYTGEDVVEISCHGNQLILQEIINLYNKANIRQAEPGEFTKRAFLNGKMDLSQAEAVADIIFARTQASLRGARNQLDGFISKKINLLRQQLIDITSLIELELDFAEEDIELIKSADINLKINSTISGIEKLLDSYKFGRVIRDGINVAIVGDTNVGKSSLLNYLLKESRAIVNEIPGTTRDIIREDISIDGYLFKLYDTAGIRETIDKVEEEGVKRSRDTIQKADIVLLVNDITKEYSKRIYSEILNLTEESRIIKLFNKIDLTEERESEGVNISVMTGEGIGDLLERMKSMVVDAKAYTEQTAIISNIRHYEALNKAKKELGIANKSIKDKMSGEFTASNLRNAINYLGEIIGEITSDDILNNIFSKFCIGK